MNGRGPTSWWRPLGRGFPIYALAASFLYAWVQGGVLAYHILGFTVTLLVLALLTGLAPLSGVQVERQLPGHPVDHGDTVPVRLQVRLPRWWPWVYLTVFDQVPEGLPGAPNAEFLVFPWFQRRLVLEYALPSVNRGVYRFTTLTVGTGDLFGFFLRSREIERRDELEVWPRRISLQVVHALPREWQGDLRLAILQTNESSELRSIRDYVPGDRLSRIHWQTTARTGSFMVKQFEPLTIPALSVVVDQSGSFTAHQFEVGLEVAASFIEYGLDRGQDVGLIMLGRDLVVEPDAGQVQRVLLMRELAAARWRSDPVEPVLRFAGPQLSAATVLVTGRAPNGVRVRQAHVALVIHVGRHDAGPSVESLQDLPRVLSYGGRL
ncbi:MAG: DUF58 domain-containing protein [Clostridia bacterium]